MVSRKGKLHHPTANHSVTPAFPFSAFRFPKFAYLLLFLLILAYIVGYTWMSWHLHATFITSADDLSNVDQVVWNSQNGRLLERTTGTRSLPRYGEHVEPIWIALGLLYWGWDDVRLLLLAQTVALAMGALPVFWWARRAWGRDTPDYPAGLTFAALYLLNPFVSRANIAEVHATPFAVAPMLFALYWGWQGKWARVVPLVLLVLLVREDMGLLLLGFGGWLLVQGIIERRKGKGRDAGRGTRDAGRGTRDAGRGTRGEGEPPFVSSPVPLGRGNGGPDLTPRPPLHDGEGENGTPPFAVSPFSFLLSPSQEGGPDLTPRPPLHDGEGENGTPPSAVSPFSFLLSPSSFPLSPFQAALALIATGIAGLFIMVFGIIGTFADERFSGESDSIFLGRYAAFGESPLGIVVGMMTRWEVWAELFRDPYRLHFLRDFVLSTGGLGLFAPTTWVLFLPHFLLNLLSDYFGQYGSLQHYGAPLVPGMMVAAILGGATLLKWGRYHPAWRWVLLAVAVAGGIFTARTATGQPLAADWITPTETAHHRLLANFIRQIPPDAPTSVDPQLHPHLAHRHDAYRFPTVGENAEWILVDVTTNTTRHPADLKSDIEALLAGEWGIADAQDGYLLLQKGNSTKTIPPEFYTFAHAPTPPDMVMGIPLETVTIDGYSLRQDFWGRVAIEWQLTPTAPLGDDVQLDAALFMSNGLPITDTAAQPIPALLWQPISSWQVGERYLLRTLPRHPTSPFYPALTVYRSDTPLAVLGGGNAASPLRIQAENGWWWGGEWYLENNRAERGTDGWRYFTPPIPLNQARGSWDVAELGAWKVDIGATEIHLTLLWQSRQSGSPPVQRFVHVVPREGPPIPISQADAPLGGDYPINQWAEGEWVMETITLPRPADGSAWRLLVGLYDPATGTRFAVTPNAGDQTFEVK